MPSPPDTPAWRALRAHHADVSDLHLRDAFAADPDRAARYSADACGLHLDYAKNRIQFGGRPIAAQQIIQQRLVWMYNEIVKAQLLALQLGRMKDAGTMTHEAVSLAKRNNVWVARECAKLAREIHGANGIVNEYPIMRHLMNIESVYTYEGTHDMHTLAVGAYLTGIRSFDPPPGE